MKRHHRLTALPAGAIATAITCVMLVLASSAAATTDMPGSPEARLHAAQRISQAATAQPTIVHETTPTRNNDPALPIALAASALLVALAGTSYSIVLATKTSRQVQRPSV